MNDYDYDYMDVLVDENDDYINVTARSSKDRSMPIIKVTDRIEIEYYLRLFCNKYCCAIDNLKKNEIPSVRFKKIAMDNNYYKAKKEKKYKSPFKGRRLKRRIISLATAGVIAVYGSFTAYNYYLKRENIYNNKYVHLHRAELSNNAKIEGEMYNLLANYDEFDNNMNLLVDQKWDHINQDDLSSVFSNLNLILHSNDVYFKDFYLNDIPYDGPLYTFNLYKYFENSTEDYFAIRRFCSYHNNILVEIQNNSKENLDKEIRKYIEDIGRFLFDDTYIGATGMDQNTKMLSPLAKYIITEMSRPIIENGNFGENEALYKNCTKEDFLKGINVLTAYNRDTIIVWFGNGKKNSASK